MVRRLLALALLSAALSGCMKVREELLVMPDGSGRITFTFSIPAKSEAGKFTEAELMAVDPDEIQDKVRGIAAMTRPAGETKDGVVRVRMTAYFDDVNALKFMDDGEGDKAKPKQEFAFRKDGEAFSLEVKGSLVADDVPERPAGNPEAEKARDVLAKAMFAGFEFRNDVTMPGKATSAEGFGGQDGRVATFGVGEKDFQTAADRKKVNALRAFKVSCGRSEVTEGEAAEFRKELEAAKAAWPELRKEMKKSAGKK
jgi:hypothetical protein